MLPTARRELLALRGPIQNQVRTAIRSLGDDPLPAGSIAMKGKGIGLHRLRVGSYRVVYRLQAEHVFVLVIRIGHRSEIYRGLERR
jgi:mRNA interferase RelE/StbE